jgi:uncharacterized protein YdeI (YjbR/CyaY-like superfamily)
MQPRKTLYVTNPEDWRAWLTKHHQSETEVWLIYYKKQSGRPRISYDHAVEEALCFGWIDSIVKKIDDGKFAQKFTPRRNWTKWSMLNKRRLRKLIRDGRMTPAGLAKVDRAILANGPRAKPGKEDADIPPLVKQALTANAKVWENFSKLAQSRRKQYVHWIMEPKKEETRERRLRDIVSRLGHGDADPDDVPAFVKQVLVRSAKAWENFKNLAPSYRRNYIGWIMHAAKEETRQRRLQEAVALLEQNQKLGLK